MEIELKLMLDAEDHARLVGVLPACLRSLRQRNHYFDDRGRSLARSGWGLRLREETGPAGERRQLTLKHSGDSGSEFSHRAEYERDVAVAEFERFLARPQEILEAARALLPRPSTLPSVQIYRIGSMDNRRDVHALPGVADLLVELDHTTWPDHTESFELELELDTAEQESEARGHLRVLLDRAGVEWRVGHQTKLARLMRILDARA